MTMFKKLVLYKRQTTLMTETEMISITVEKKEHFENHRHYLNDLSLLLSIRHYQQQNDSHLKQKHVRITVAAKKKIKWIADH